jgi:molecular chaperone DnaK (HSP70)
VPYLLGIDIGSSTTKAAVRRFAGRPESPAWGPARPVPLDARSRTVSSALVLTSAGVIAPMDAGDDGVTEPVRGFVRRVGDHTPLLLGENYYPAPELVAAMARWVVDVLWIREEELPERIAIAYPTGWGPARLGLLRAALDEVGLDGAVLVTRARAVTESHQVGGRLPAAGGALGVCRIGGSSVEVSAVLAREPGRLELLGTAELDEIGGWELAGAAPAEARAMLQAIVDFALRTVRGCGTTPGDLGAIMIAGGAAAVSPVVQEMFASAVGVPVVRDDDPQLTVACGAALAAGPRPPGGQPRSTAVARRPPAPDLSPVAASATGEPEIERPRRPLPDSPARPPVRVPTLTVSRR